MLSSNMMPGQNDASSSAEAIGNGSRLSSSTSPAPGNRFSTISRSQVAPLFYLVYEVLGERIRQSLATRGAGLRFIQIFNYVYQDGAPMFTVGGIVGTEDDERALRGAGIFSHRFVRRSKNYLEISVPPLTIREKQWLDCRLDDWLTVKKLSFELEAKLLQNYCKCYKEYPTYLETLL